MQIDVYACESWTIRRHGQSLRYAANKIHSEADKISTYLFWHHQWTDHGKPVEIENE